MNDRPTAAELLDAVRAFLESDLLPTLSDARLRFQTLVAVNVLAIAAREMPAEEAMLREEWHALAPLVGGSGTPPAPLSDLRAEVRTMNDQLGTAIRAGAFDEDEPFRAVADILRRLVVRKLEIANPRYLTAASPS